MWDKYKQMLSFIESAYYAKTVFMECFSEGAEAREIDDRIVSAMDGLIYLIGYLVDEAAELKAWHQEAVNDHKKQMEVDAATLEKLNEAKAKAEIDDPIEDHQYWWDKAKQFSADEFNEAFANCALTRGAD